MFQAILDTLNKIDFQQTAAELERLNAKFMEGLQNSKHLLGKVGEITRLHQDIMTLACEEDTYEDPERLQKLKVHVKRLNQVKIEIREEASKLWPKSSSN